MHGRTSGCRLDLRGHPVKMAKTARTGNPGLPVRQGHLASRESLGQRGRQDRPVLLDLPAATAIINSVTSSWAVRARPT